MSDAKLPPGPWSIKHGTNVYAGLKTHHMRGRLIANTGAYSENKRIEETHEENLAIARTIATLPELLAVVDAAILELSGPLELAAAYGPDFTVDRDALPRAIYELQRRRNELEEQNDA